MRTLRLLMKPFIWTKALFVTLVRISYPEWSFLSGGVQWLLWWRQGSLREDRLPQSLPLGSTSLYALNNIESSLDAGITPPPLHYCVGGLAINAQAQCLNEQREVIKGLYAAGEVCGGVHGGNRLAGCSLLDCIVFGRRAGKFAN